MHKHEHAHILPARDGRQGFSHRGIKNTSIEHMLSFMVEMGGMSPVECILAHVSVVSNRNHDINTASH